MQLNISMDSSIIINHLKFRENKKLYQINILDNNYNKYNFN